MAIKTKLFIGFFTLITLFIANYLIHEKLSSEVIKNMDYLAASENIIQNSNLLHKNMINMQNGFRGYLLTGQDVFLQPYTEGLLSVGAIMIDQKSLLHSAKQEQRLDSIFRLHSEWIEYANSLVAAKQNAISDGDEKYLKLFEGKLKKEVGKKLNDQIKILFVAFDKSEYTIRDERKSGLQRSIGNTHFISLALTVISVIIGLLVGYVIVRQITGRISSMVRLSEEISKGHFITMKNNRNDELTTLSKSLNKMSLKLEQSFNELVKKNNELDQFAYVVSHDLKAPLRGIDNITKWIEEDHETEITPGIQKNLELIKGRTKRLESMINGLLDYARVGKVKRQSEAVDAEKLIREISDLILPVSFSVKLEGKMPVITTNKLFLEQVFSNLLSNAVKYSDKQEGVIKIRVKEDPEFYVFEVEDNGPGIAKEYHEKIFQIFQTLQERDAFESTGVGLAIVKKIVEEQNGIIRVESTTGKGSKFIFSWPKNLDNIITETKKS